MVEVEEALSWCFVDKSDPLSSQVLVVLLPWLQASSVVALVDSSGRYLECRVGPSRHYAPVCRLKWKSVSNVWSIHHRLFRKEASCVCYQWPCDHVAAKVVH